MLNSVFQEITSKSINTYSSDLSFHMLLLQSLSNSNGVHSVLFLVVYVLDFWFYSFFGAYVTPFILYQAQHNPIIYALTKSQF